MLSGYFLYDFVIAGRDLFMLLKILVICFVLRYHKIKGRRFWTVLSRMENKEGAYGSLALADRTHFGSRH